jgi:hypothetical protein
MNEYQIIVESMNAEDAREKLLAWFDQHKTVHERLLARNGPEGSEDLLGDVVRAEGGTRFQYRIRRSLLGPSE